MNAGYSGTPLARKLGLGEGAVVRVINEPDGFRALLGPDAAALTFRSALRGRLDVVIAFLTAAAELRERRDAMAKSIFPDGAIWVAWPKRASKVPTDITEDVVRDIVLPHGLVDVKVCAIDDTWSGLRVVWRKERRGV